MPPVRTGVSAIDTVLGGLPRGELVAFISCGAHLSSAATALVTGVARSDRVVHAVWPSRRSERPAPFRS